MKQYDVKCPVCGAMNRGLFMEETGGWMACDCCHSATQNGSYMRQHTRRIPHITMGQRLLHMTQCTV